MKRFLLKDSKLRMKNTEHESFAINYRENQTPDKSNLFQHDSITTIFALIINGYG